MSAVKVIQPRQPASVHNLSDGQLADEHRNLSLGIWRYEQRKKLIEEEFARRGRPSYEGDRAVATLQIGDIGLVDIKRIRADLGENICREYAVPGSDRFWRSTDKAK